MLRRSKRTEVDELDVSNQQRAQTEDSSPEGLSDQPSASASELGASTHPSEMNAEGVHAWIDLHRPSLSETLADAGVDDIETA